MENGHGSVWSFYASSAVIKPTNNERLPNRNPELLLLLVVLLRVLERSIGCALRRGRYLPAGRRSSIQPEVTPEQQPAAVEEKYDQPKKGV